MFVADKVSEAILALKPVTFHYRKELNPYGSPQFGISTALEICSFPR